MGFLDEVGKVLDEVETATPIDLIIGIAGAVTDVPSLVGNVAKGDIGRLWSTAAGPRRRQGHRAWPG